MLCLAYSSPPEDLICQENMGRKKDKSRGRNLRSSSLFYSEWLGKKIKEERKKKGEYSWGVLPKDTPAVGWGNSKGPFTSSPDSVSGLRATARKTNSCYQAFVRAPEISFLIMPFLSQRSINCWEYSKAKRVPFLPCRVAFRELMWPSHQAMLER